MDFKFAPVYRSVKVVEDQRHVWSLKFSSQLISAFFRLQVFTDETVASPQRERRKDQTYSFDAEAHFCIHAYAILCTNQVLPSQTVWDAETARRTQSIDLFLLFRLLYRTKEEKHFGHQTYQGWSASSDVKRKLCPIFIFCFSIQTDR